MVDPEQIIGQSRGGEEINLPDMTVDGYTLRLGHGKFLDQSFFGPCEIVRCPHLQHVFQFDPGGGINVVSALRVVRTQDEQR